MKARVLSAGVALGVVVTSLAHAVKVSADLGLAIGFGLGVLVGVVVMLRGE